jgi:aspartyl-tRNA(Asn)/glutamyl-tRNA(Gln) amidotransferase subunit A
MARSAEDCELMLEVMAGHDPEDPTSLAEEMGAPLTLSEALRLRVGIVRTPIPEGGDPACDRVFDAAVEALRRAGLSPREVTLPDLPVESAAWVLIVGEGSSAFASVFEGGFDREMADPDAPLAQAMSRLVHAADYLKAMRVRNLAQRAYADLFSEVDAIFALTYPFTAPPAEGSFAKYFNAPDPVGAAGNLCGLPGMAVPAGFGSDGLPLGIVFMAGACEDRKALALGRLYQSVTDWHSMKPPIAL